MGIENMQPIKTAPKDGTYIFLFGCSGYTNFSFRVVVGRWVPGFRDHWIDVANDAFTDGGDDPLGWAPITNEIEDFLQLKSQIIIFEQKLKELRKDRVEGKIDDMKDWYFTFCHDQKFPSGYVKINGTFKSARQTMFDHFGACWGFQYESAEDAGVDRYLLEEVNIDGDLKK